MLLAIIINNYSSCMITFDNKWFDTLYSVANLNHILIRVSCSKMKNLKIIRKIYPISICPGMTGKIILSLQYMVYNGWYVDKITSNNACDPLYVHARKEKEKEREK